MQYRKPGRRRTIFKHVSQVRIALGAADFCPDHPVRRVSMLDYAATFGRLVETRPARPRIKLGLRIKQRRTRSTRSDTSPASFVSQYLPVNAHSYPLRGSRDTAQA